MSSASSSGGAAPRPRLAAVLAAAVMLSACAQQPAPEPFVVAWGGDVLLGDAAQAALEEHGFGWPFERIEGLLEADYVIVNAEGPITDITEHYFPEQEFSYNADPAAARALADVGIDAVSLSNNHAFDRGPDGLRETIEHLELAGVAHFGAGTDPDALSPHLVETPAGRLAVIGLGSGWTYGVEATARDFGTASMDAETIARAHELAVEADARWVVAFVHWGENYSGVTDSQREAARRFAAAGYDLVIGHHPHVPQEAEIVDGMPVLYSLGNLVFGTPGRFDAGEGYGLIARTLLAADGSIEIRLACIVTDNDAVAFQPEPCAPAEADGVFGRLGPHLRVIDGEAVVQLPD